MPMMGSLGFLKNRLAKNIRGRGTALVVFWSSIEGGELNPSTQAMVGGTETYYSGTLTALAVQTIPRESLRQFQEIQTGDLIVDCQPDPEVFIYPGQSISGCVPLSAIADSGVQFLYNGNLYVQADVGEQLASIWSLIVEGVPLMDGILLRRQT